MRVVHTEAALINAVQMTKTEAGAAFNNPPCTWRNSCKTRAILRSKCWLTNTKTRCIWVSETAQCKDATKVIEEAPAPGIARKLIEKIGDRCVAACKRIGYRGAGTFEFFV